MSNPKKYATETGELDVSCVRARAVGNAVYLEHIGGNGDIATWGESDFDRAHFVAGQINLIVNTLRAKLGDSANRAGTYAYEKAKEILKLRNGLLRMFARCENWSVEDMRANIADILELTVADIERSVKELQTPGAKDSLEPDSPKPKKGKK